MLYLSIAIVLVALIAGYLVNKKLDQDFQINSKSADVEISVAVDNALKKYNDRINTIFEKHSDLKQAFESLKLQISLKGRQ